MPANYIQACTNGRLHDACEPSISSLNRGFLYGDAIYEVWRTYNRVIFAWEEHWRRLEQSAAALFLTLPFSAATALKEIRRTVEAYHAFHNSSGELYIRLQVTRGSGAIGLDPALADRADYVILVQQNTLYPPEKLRAGLKLRTATKLRRNAADTLNPAWKTGNYLNNILCLREARVVGADEVVILNLAGEITEAAVSNLAFVRKGEIVTPPLSAGLLGGITRGLLIGKIAQRVGCAVCETTIRPDELSGMDECFLLSTTKDVTPVASIDDCRFALGENTLTSRLKSAFLDYADSYSNAHSHLRIG